MMQVKGSVLMPIPEFIKAKFSTDGFEKWLSVLSPEAASIYDHIIMPLNLYPMKTALTDPTIKMCELFYGGDYSGARELGRFVADFTMKGYKKYMAKIVSPAYLIKQTPKVITLNWLPTAVENVELSANHAVVRITEFLEMHEVIENRFLGFAERSIEIAGGKNLKMELSKSLLKGNNCTEFIFDWE